MSRISVFTVRPYDGHLWTVQFEVWKKINNREVWIKGTGGFALSSVLIKIRSDSEIAFQAMSARSVLKNTDSFLFLPEKISSSGDRQSCLCPEDNETRLY